MTQRLQQIAQQLSASRSQCNSQKCLLASQVVIVTGGAQGIGEAVVTLFAQHGAKIAISDIDAERSQRLVEKLEKEGVDAAYFPGDLLDLSFPQTLIQQVLKRFGKINCLVNNAGMHSKPVNPASSLMVYERLPER
ncbi:hypothetical protein LTR10_012712 [Elasticomyces elasticus]|uniref:Uncharacterized protein n=1 Tax=Exophiala sideris TaxID=1016849 RepID=A0ABR0JR88_9EURO|nr:hypothetical protein LTR10_012712 [Elasticomyces elasticus]KAK5034590.1 hypothetical protein LTR13_006245 [Exophiala sideris]KAK5040089.1 hypothetical protein LTS07_000586 [Exophiala sideris]KAK5068467.1 hypothetical protein LTR69_000587 [Exophiala sideris]KAK5187769.1 hypothetical protein LTR44_000587 [Eurotiomycetes sp. CCFEE 6388]